MRLRRPSSCDPCGDAQPRWRVRRGCAYVNGSRAPCDGAGCSAGTCACSRACSPMLKTLWANLRWLAEGSTPDLFAGDRPTVRAALIKGQTSGMFGATRRNRCDKPVDSVLLRAGRPCYVRQCQGSPPHPAGLGGFSTTEVQRSQPVDNLVDDQTPDSHCLGPHRAREVEPGVCPRIQKDGP